MIKLTEKKDKDEYREEEKKLHGFDSEAHCKLAHALIVPLQKKHGARR